MFNGIAFNRINENEDKDVKRDAYYAEKIKKIKITYKESPFKSIIQDIKRGLYYIEKMNNLSTSDMKSTKEKLVNLKTNYLIIIIIIIITRLKKILMSAKALNMLGICLMKIITKKLIFIRLNK